MEGDYSQAAGGPPGSDAGITDVGLPCHMLKGDMSAGGDMDAIMGDLLGSRAAGGEVGIGGVAEGPEGVDNDVSIDALSIGLKPPASGTGA